MEASVSPSAGTGLPGLGLSMTPFSIPESSVSMKSTVSANETGIEGRIQEEEERNTKIGKKEKRHIWKLQYHHQLALGCLVLVYR
ncbi:hypothetical protein QQG55_50565 [Brugia pahangi]